MHRVSLTKSIDRSGVGERWEREIRRGRLRDLGILPHRNTCRQSSGPDFAPAARIPLLGFGFTTVPAERNYTYTFVSLTTTINAFLDARTITSFARPDAITAIISQNANAYIEGLGTAAVIRDNVLTFETTKWQYTHGSRTPEAIAPEAYTLDWPVFQRPGNIDVQLDRLDLLRDYKHNVALYPQFQEYLRKSQVPLLAVWGKHDQFFIPAGAEAYKRDPRDAEVVLLDAGRMAVEIETAEIAARTLKFLNNVFNKVEKSL
ncbi:Alpha/Beta hydrolase protein [Mycena haematopus]|nr:Alpha/Beta hydrolase protein [Mycena haematopus]